MTIEIQGFVQKHADSNDIYLDAVFGGEFFESSSFVNGLNSDYWNTINAIKETMEGTPADSAVLSDSPRSLSEKLQVPYFNVYATVGGVAYSNVLGATRSSITKDAPIYFVFENGLITDFAGTTFDFAQSRTYGSMDFSDQHATADQHTPVPYTIVIAYDDNYITANQARWDASTTLLRNELKTQVTLLFFLLLLVVYLAIVTGRRPGDDVLKTQLIDRLWSEISLCLLLFSGLIYILLLGQTIVASFYCFTQVERILFQLLLGGVTVAGFSVILYFLLSIVRKFKDRTVFSNTFIGFLWRQMSGIYRTCKNFITQFSRKDFANKAFTQAVYNLQRRYIIISAINVFFTFLFVFIFFPIAILFVFFELLVTYSFIKRSNTLTENMAEILVQINQTEQGNLDYLPPIDPNALLYPYSQKLANLSDGLKNALDKQLRDERMKIELVTNVSHDLKTPLTSIISYIDLLGQEELGDVSKDYVGILSQKSLRLKSIVADLFDLTKSTSGNLEIAPEVIDLKKLVEQTVADMSDQIFTSNMVVKTTLPDSPVPVISDGKRISRVLQNLLDNALKYSLRGSRIYIDLTIEENSGLMTIKNTSCYEMDFVATDITERFARGDKMRSTEGSGLGLSIAKSFTEVCGGTFDVTLDGDQFKVFLAFPLSEEQPIL